MVLTGSLAERALWMLYPEFPNPVASPRLAEFMWGGEPPHTWASAFRTHVARLRRILERHPEGPQVRRDSSGYRLEMPEGSVDVDVFRDLIRRSRTAPSPDLRYELVDSASKLVFGDPFHGTDGWGPA